MLQVLELFAGIGACSKALTRLGIEHEIVDAVEIDKYAIKSFNAIHGTSFEPQDICQWDNDIKVDLIMHGSPCQDFSLAGKQAGGDKNSGTRSSLMYETLRIVEKLKPKYVVWENVKNLLSQKHRHNFETYLKEMERLGYTNSYRVLNAKDYGIPQNRERVFTVSILGNSKFDFPPKQELKLKLKDLLEDKVDEKYYLSEKAINFFYENERVQKEKGNGFRFGVSDGNIVAKTITTRAGSRMDDNFIKIKNNTKKGYLETYEGDSVNLEQPSSKTRRGRVGHEVSQTLTTSCNQGVVTAAAMRGRENGQQIELSNREYSNALTTVQKDSLVNENLKIRKLTPKECWRLMGFDDEDFEKAEKVNSNTQLYKQAGNSIVVNVLEAIFKNMGIADSQENPKLLGEEQC